MTAAAAKKPAPRSLVRDWCETAAFVVALVLMLKLFAVEAFVIPTGSMAETLYGYQKTVECPECKHQYPVNSSYEVDPPDGQPRPVVAATCPNCRYFVQFGPGRVPPPANNSGDRVLVHKAMYHVDGGPARGDVVVFKFPVDPQVGHTAQNYIKRLWGLGGETLAVYRGDLYATTALTYPAGERDANGLPRYPRPDDPRRLWEGPEASQHSKVRPRFLSLETDFTYHNTPAAQRAFAAARDAGVPAGLPADGFQPLRKTDAQALAMRRLVCDADHPSPTLVKRGLARWQPDGAGWTPDGTGFRHAGGDLGFVRYRHLVPVNAGGWDRESDPGFAPAPVTNFLGYNNGVDAARYRADESWVGDLLLEARVDAATDARVVFELSRGLHRFRAEFAGGEVAISKSGRELARRPAAITGSHDLRFANVDGRLRVWVDGRAVAFGAAADYPPADAVSSESLPGALAGGPFAARPDGSTLQNDVLAPAAVGASGTATVTRVKLWADTFFTRANNGFHPPADPDDPADTFYVHPGHYLCLGDNSGQSSDSRKWGLVPERLMLGRACFVFFPLDRLGFIR